MSSAGPTRLSPAAVDTRAIASGLLLCLPGYVVGLTYGMVCGVLTGVLFFDSVHITGKDLYVVMDEMWIAIFNSIVLGFPAAFLSVGIALPLAYRLRYAPLSTTLFALIVLLAPFFISPLILYYGIQTVIGAGYVQTEVALAYRYLPLVLSFMVLAMGRLPMALPAVVHNLSISTYRKWSRIIMPVILSQVVLLVLFTGLSMSLDTLAASVMNGGRLQGVGNLIELWAVSSGFHSVASALTLVFMFCTCAVVVVLLFGTEERIPRLFNPASARDSVTGRAGRVLVHPALIVYGVSYAAICWNLTGFAAGPADNAAPQWATVWYSVGVSVAVIAISAGSAVAIGLTVHIRSGGLESLVMRLFRLIFITALLIPPIIAAQSAITVQGQYLHLGGSTATIVFWDSIFIGPLLVVMLLLHPFVSDSTLYKTAQNYCISPIPYVRVVFMPQIFGAVFSASSLIIAMVICEPMIAQYVGGFNKNLGARLMLDQQSALSQDDYVFMGWFGFLTQAALVAIASVTYWAHRPAWVPDSITDAERHLDFPNVYEQKG